MATLPGSPSDVALVDVSKPDGNGMSSDTVIFTIRWDGAPRPLVARVEPSGDDLPVFESYDLEVQRRIMDLVARETSAPVPAPVFGTDDRSVLGVPFFVMDRVGGRVPPDVLPYTFPGDGWMQTASPQELATLERSAVATLAAIHEIGPASHDLGFLDGSGTITAHLDRWARYLEWVTRSGASPLLTEAFAWLRANLPHDLGEVRLAWGDARIGNMIFDDFDVVAVLDWEMADVAPVEVDLGWMTYLHRFFQDITTDLGEPGLPDLLRPSRVKATYEELTGRPVGDLRWPMTYAAVRHGTIMRRVGERMVAFGEREPVADPDELVMNGPQIRSMIDGGYWESVDL